MKTINTKTQSLTDTDIERIGNLLDNRLAPLVTKKELQVAISGLETKMDGLENSLKDYIHQGIEGVMDGMDRLSEQLAEKERVNKLEGQIRLIAQKVGVKL